MSQNPNDLAIGNLVNSTRINIAPAVGRQGVNQSAIAPGLAVPPPVSRGADLAGQLMNVLGMATNAVGAVGTYVRQSAADEERNRLQMEREQRIAEQADRGTASLEYRQALPGDLAKIANREWLVPDGAKVEEYVNQEIDRRVQGMGAAYAETYRAGASPDLIKAFIAQQEGIKTDAKNGLLTNLTDAAFAAKTPDDLKKLVTTAGEIDSRLTETERYSVLIKAGRAAADAGNTDQVNNIVSVLGTRFSDEQAKWKLDLASASDRQQREINDQARQTFSGMVLNNQSTDSIIEAVNGMKDVENNVRLDLIESAKNIGIQRQRQTFSNYAQQFKSNAVSAVADQMFSGSLPLSGAGIQDLAVKASDLGLTIPENPSFNVSADKLRSEALQMALDRTAFLYGPQANMTPVEQAAALDKSLSQQVAMVSRYRTVKAPAFTDLVNAGATASLSSLVYDPKTDAVNGQVSSADMTTVAQAFAVWQKFQDQNPQYLPSAGGISDRTMNFYRNVEISMRYVTPGDMKKAIPAAIIAMQRQGEGTGSLDKARSQDVQTAVKSALDGGWFTSDAKNFQDVAAKVSTIAQMRTYFNNLAPADAVKAALDDVKRTHTQINGYMVYTGGTQSPAAIQDFSDIAIANYVKSHPGTDGSNLTFAPFQGGSVWTLIQGDTGIPVDDWNKYGVGSFTLDQLGAMKLAMMQEEDRKKAVETIKAQGQARNVAERQARGQYTVGELVKIGGAGAVNAVKNDFNSLLDDKTFNRRTSLDTASDTGAQVYGRNFKAGLQTLAVVPANAVSWAWRKNVEGYYAVMKLAADIWNTPVTSGSADIDLRIMQANQRRDAELINRANQKRGNP